MVDNIQYLKSVLANRLILKRVSRAFGGIPKPREYSREERKLIFMSQVSYHYNYIINKILYALRF